MFIFEYLGHSLILYLFLQESRFYLDFCDISIETIDKDRIYATFKKMKKTGKPIEEIIEFTGLTKEEIEKL